MADSTRRVRVVLELEAKTYERVLKQQAQQTKTFASQARTDFSGMTRDLESFMAGPLRRTGREFQAAAKTVTTAQGEMRQGFDTLGIAATGFGVAVGAAFVSAARSAIAFESSFAGVRKTVDGTEQQLQGLSDGLRQMAVRDVPVAVSALADIAASAGQLGIQTNNVLGFTRVIADLSVATNLAGEQGAQALARLANITGMAQGDFDRLGSTVVALGNNLATTEAEIVNMGLRIAGAGEQVGLTEAQVLGFAGAMSSVGIEAEAGGTAFSRIMVEIADQVASTGPLLDDFAAVAGMSAAEFAAAFRDDAAGAIVTFVSGLGTAGAAGENLFGILEDLGLSDIRVRDALLRMSSSSDLLTDSLDLGSQAWEDNTALAEEAATRYGTVESRVLLARNALSDLAIDVGEILLPAIGGAADAVAGLAGGFGDLPGPVKTIAVLLSGLVGATSLAAGGFLLMAPRIVATKAALSGLAATMPGTVGALRGVGSFLAGPWGLALAGATVALGLFTAAEGHARQEAEQLRGSLDKFGRALPSQIEGIVAQIGPKAAEAFDTVGLSISRVTAAAVEGPDAVRDLAREMAAMAGTVPARSLDVVTNALFDLEDRMRRGAESNRDYAEAQRAADRAAGDFSSTIDAYRSGGFVSQVGGQVLALQQADQTFASLTEAQHASMGAAIAWAAANDGVSESTARFTEGITAAGQASMGAAIAIHSGTESILAQRAAFESSLGAMGAALNSFGGPMDAFESSLDDGATSLGEWMEEMETIQLAQDEFAINMALLATRVSDDTFAAFQQMAERNPEQAALMAAQAVNATDEELARLEGVVGGHGQDAIDALAGLQPQMETIAEQFGQGTVDHMVDKLRSGIITVADIAWAYGESLRTGVNPLLLALGGDSIPAQARALGIPVGVHRNAGGPIPGGGPDRDSVLMYGTPGEWVINRGASQHYGDDTMAAVNERRAIIQPLNTGGRVTGDVEGLHPEFMRRLALWSAGVGQTYHVGSGYRSIAEQAVLYDRWLRRVPGQAPAAPPGGSNHNFGLASDGPRWGGRDPGNYGLTYPMSYEPWHVEPFNARAMRGTSFVDLPPVPSVSPYSGAVGEPASAQMTFARAAAQQWLEDQFSFGAIAVPGQEEGGGAGGTAAANRELGRAMAAARGWGAHWASLNALVMGESGWRHTAQNPTSTAFGIGQFLNSTWSTVGATKTSDPMGQIAAMLDYIASRYGTPTGAYQAWQSRSPHWYDQGGWLMPGTTMAVNNTGQPERIIGPGETVDVRVVNVGDLVPPDLTVGAQALAHLAQIVPSLTVGAQGLSHLADIVPSLTEGARGLQTLTALLTGDRGPLTNDQLLAGLFGAGPVQTLLGSPGGRNEANDMAALDAALTGPHGRETGAEIGANREQIRIEGLSAAERLAEVEAAMAETTEYTDEWVALLREAERLEGQIADEAARAAQESGRLAQELQAAADAAVDLAQADLTAAQRQADSILADMNRLLDRKAALDRQAAEATVRAGAAVAAAEARAARDIAGLIRARDDALGGAFGSVTSPFSVGWGNLPGQAADELDRRFELADEAFDKLDELRDRGVSEDLIDAYGLADPSQLATLRLFVAGSDTELRRLDSAISRNQNQTAQRAEEESTLLLGALGRSIIEVRGRLVEETTVIRGDLTDQLQQIAGETAMLGMETGRGWADALTGALESGLPGLVAMAGEYQAALAVVQVAANALAAAQGAAASPLAPTLQPGVAPSGGRYTLRPPSHADIAGGGSPAFSNPILLASTYDSGGVLPPGTRLVTNATGRDEYVLTPEQLRSMRPAGGGQTTAVVNGPIDLVLDDGTRLSGWVRSQARGAAREDAYRGRVQQVAG